MDRQTQKGINYLPERGKMAALGRLSCKVAHDINNILAAIEGYATLAMDGADSNDRVARNLREIRLAVAEAASLAKKLLVFGGMQMLHMAPCGVNGIIANILKRPELAPGGDFRIETLLEPGLPGLTADAAQLGRALTHLLVNAREAMPGGGTAVITARAVRLENGAVYAPKPPEAGHLFIRLAVRDSGAGISAGAFEHLFEPLFSTTDKGRGAGWGLSTVYGVVRQHNGWVEVKSEPGRGSEFSIFLPAADGPRPPGSPPHI